MGTPALQPGNSITLDEYVYTPNDKKTLVFWVTQGHALAVRDLINQMKTSMDPNYCQRVTANDGALGEQHLRDFQDNGKSDLPDVLAHVAYALPTLTREERAAKAKVQITPHFNPNLSSRSAAFRG